MMHGGPPSALLAHAIEQVQPGGELAVSRLISSFSEAGGLQRAGVVLKSASARLKHHGSLPAEISAPGPPSPRAIRPAAARRPDRPSERFYPAATEIRVIGGEGGSGHAVAWIRLRGELLPGVAQSPLARCAAAAHFTNGLSWILPFEDWLFVNTELTLHLHREPEGEWIGLDARTRVGASGIGLATGVLHDDRGPLGVCAQSLFLERR